MRDLDRDGWPSADSVLAMERKRHADEILRLREQLKHQCELNDAAADEIERLNAQTLSLVAEISGLRRELAEVVAALPKDARYLDPPDGGDVPIAEQVKRMCRELKEARGLLKKAAGKLRELDGYSGANFVDLGIGIDGADTLASIDAWLGKAP